MMGRSRRLTGHRRKYTAEPKAMHTTLEFADNLDHDSGDVFEMIRSGT